MDINEFKKLEESIKDESFDKSYKNINIVMFYLSIFGHVSSIFLAYFMLSKVLSSAIINNFAVVFIASIILLGGLELLKRDIFQKFSSIHVKTKSLSGKVRPLMMLSILIISISFYSSINGAKEFSSKSKDIEVKTQNSVQIYQDSITNVYNNQINQINNNITSIKNSILSKDQEETSIESTPPLTLDQRNRVRDLKGEKQELKADVIKEDSSINTLKNELNSKIKDYKDKTTSLSSEQKDENKNNSLLFIIISTLIEITILAGVYFNTYYKVKSYNDFKEKIEKDPNYQKWFLYNSILDIIYNNETTANDKMPSLKNIIDICKVNGINVFPKDMTNCMKLLSSMNIIKTSGSAKYYVKTKEQAKEILKDHFKIK